MADATHKAPANPIANTVKLAGEIFVPGASELIEGHVASGVGTFVATGVAAALLAPSMPLLATLAVIGLRVNSFKHSTSGHYLWEKMIPAGSHGE